MYGKNWLRLLASFSAGTPVLVMKCAFVHLQAQIFLSTIYHQGHELLGATDIAQHESFRRIKDAAARARAATRPVPILRSTLVGSFLVQSRTYVLHHLRLHYLSWSRLPLAWHPIRSWMLYIRVIAFPNI